MGSAGRWLLLAALFVAVGSWHHSFAEEAHERAGALTPYDHGPPEIDLSLIDLVNLESGETLIRRIRVDQDDRVLAVIRVNASPSVIWSVLLDFHAYPQWVDGLEASNIYHRNGSDIYVSFDYRHWLAGDVSYHVRHSYPGETVGWGTWTLDYSRPSDLDDTVGFWRVVAVSGDPDSADVAYSTRVRLGGWLERWIGDWLIEDTLRTVTAGLKSRAERKYR